MRLFILLSLMIFTAAPAIAADVVPCGQPVPSGMNTTVSENYCDIHQRRIDYYREDKKFKAELKERQENYNAPRAQAMEKYRQAIEELNAERKL